MTTVVDWRKSAQEVLNMDSEIVSTLIAVLLLTEVQKAEDAFLSWGLGLSVHTKEMYLTEEDLAGNAQPSMHHA